MPRVPGGTFAGVLVRSDVRLLAGVASAVLALVCLASAGRLTIALRRGGSRQGAALVWTMAALAIGAGAGAAAIALDYDTSLVVLASAALIAAAAALVVVLIGNVEQLVDGGRGKRQLALLAEQRGNALATATRLSEVAERARRARPCSTCWSRASAPPSAATRSP